MFFVYDDLAGGWSSTLYRSLGEIRDDIREVSERITELKARLNVRDIIVESLAASDDPEHSIPILEGILADAEAALHEFRTLRDKLAMLEEEWEETVCRIV